MRNEKKEIVTTIDNLLSDFLREFGKKMPGVYQPYKYTKEDVLPAWKATFFRATKAKEFCDSCIAYYSQFLSVSLPAVKEFCPDVQKLFDDNAEKLVTLLSEQLADVARRRSSYDPDVVMGGVSPVPPLVRTSFCPRMIVEMNYNGAIVRAAERSMMNFAELAGAILARAIETPDCVGS